MVVRNRQIYRDRYFEAKRETTSSVILIRASPNNNVYVFVSLVIFISICLFVLFAEYTRKESLVGVVIPQGGMVKVQANDYGYVENVFVKEGDLVDMLQPLYKIKTERFDESGNGIKKRILSSIGTQYQLLFDRKQQEKDKARIQHDYLVDEIGRVNIEINILKKVIELSESELNITKQIVEKQKTLLKNKFLSKVDYQKQQLELMSKKSRLEGNNLTIHKLYREKENLISDVKKIKINLDITLKEVERQLEAINQNRVEILNSSDSQVRSPIKGVIASILVGDGHPVTNGQPLLIIVPKAANTFIELYASSRSIGFMKVGKKVRLKFDAFPYEKFGVQAGVITSVAKTSVTAEMIPNRQLVGGSDENGVYQIKVKLSKPTITVYGKEELLIPGMTVVADVELDTRKIYEWILEPLYTINGMI